jgi:SecD/SecF fusion protein
MVLGSIEFRILANDRDNAAVMEKAKALKPEVNRLESAEGKPEARWVLVNPTSSKEFDYPGIARRTVARNGQQQLQILVLADPWNVTGRYLAEARADTDQRGRPALKFRFNAVGAKKFYQLTSAHLPDQATPFTRKLGIILDGCLYSAPSIQSAISDRGEITGNFTRKEVDDLVTVLNAGALPALLKKVSQRTEKP